MFASLQNSDAKILMPSQMVLEGRAFKRLLGHEDRAFKNGISALYKSTPEFLLLLYLHYMKM